MYTRKYRFFKWLSEYADSKAKYHYIRPHGGCNSACPRCKAWEHQGNKITTEDSNDQTQTRTCTNCGHTWKAIFTPAGFIPVEKLK